jgi:DNA-binding transcriptional regulator YiaG
MQADDVKAARLQLGMTQDQFADALGLVGGDRDRTVRNWEEGRRAIGGPAAQCIRYLLKFGPLPAPSTENGPAPAYKR